jgi:uncharacterized spore protein YtfJ
VDEELRQEITEQTRGPMDEMLERLAEKVGARANVKTVFGDPVERDGVTVIPVAKAAWGFGGGGGTGPAGAGAGGEATTEESNGMETAAQGGAATASGVGGGGGMAIAPVGYILIRQGEAEFRPIRDAAAVVRLALVGGMAALLFAGTARLLRRG